MFLLCKYEDWSHDLVVNGSTEDSTASMSKECLLMSQNIKVLTMPHTTNTSILPLDWVFTNDFELQTIVYHRNLDDICPISDSQSITTLVPVVRMNAETSPEAVRALPKCVIMVVLSSGTPTEAVNAIPRHILRVSICPETTKEMVKAIPSYVKWIDIHGRVKPEIIRALPKHFIVAGIYPDATPEAVAAIQENINHLVIPLCANREVIQSIPQHVNELSLSANMEPNDVQFIPEHINKILFRGFGHSPALTASIQKRNRELARSTNDMVRNESVLESDATALNTSFTPVQTDAVQLNRANSLFVRRMPSALHKTRQKCRADILNQQANAIADEIVEQLSKTGENTVDLSAWKRHVLQWKRHLVKGVSQYEGDGSEWQSKPDFDLERSKRVESHETTRYQFEQLMGLIQNKLKDKKPDINIVSEAQQSCLDEVKYYSPSAEKRNQTQPYPFSDWFDLSDEDRSTYPFGSDSRRERHNKQTYRQSKRFSVSMLDTNDRLNKKRRENHHYYFNEKKEELFLESYLLFVKSFCQKKCIDSQVDLSVIRKKHRPSFLRKQQPVNTRTNITRLIKSIRDFQSVLGTDDLPTFQEYIEKSGQRVDVCALENYFQNNPKFNYLKESLGKFDQLKFSEEVNDDNQPLNYQQI